MNHSQLLKEKDLKITQARIGILSYLQRIKAPADVQDIVGYLKKEKISADQATVYRILGIFTEQDLVKRVEFGEGKTRFEIASLPHHHHAICINCGSVEDIEDCNLEDIEKSLTKKTSFIVKSHNLEFFGLCKKCQ